MIFVVCLISGFGVFAAAAAAFAIGKYNLLVALRRRISNEMLQFDFALRKQSAELRTLWNNSPCNKAGDPAATDFFNRLERAEENSHRAVAGPLCPVNLAKLIAANDLIASCWNAMMKGGGEEIAGLARCRLESNAKAWENISGMFAHYIHHARKVPARWVARVSGLESTEEKT